MKCTSGFCSHSEKSNKLHTQNINNTLCNMNAVGKTKTKQINGIRGCSVPLIPSGFLV